jgi:putative heme-binding domain-containing protein
MRLETRILYPLRRDPHSGPRRATRAKETLATSRRLRWNIGWSLWLVGAALFGAGSEIRVENAAQDHPGQYSPADIVNGSRLYGEQCTTCHGPAGNLVGNVDLRRGQFRNASSDDDLKKVIATGIPNTAMPPFKFTQSELNAVVAYIRSGLDVNSRAAVVGNAARGRAIFEKKGMCATCHRVNGVGPIGLAPDLTDVGANRTPFSLQMSVLDPSAAMMPINRPIRIVMRDGKTIRARRLNEDTYSIQLVDEQGRLQSIMKADVREYEILKTSPMPAYQGKLSTEEVADLVAYLLSLRG